MTWTARRSPHPVLIIVIGLLLGFWCADNAYDFWNRDRALREHGQVTTGHVVEVTHGRGGHIRVEYTTSDRRQVTATVEGDTATPVEVGDELPIRYDPSRPADLVYDDRVTDQDYGVWVLGGFAALILIVTPLLAWSAFRSRRTSAVGGCRRPPQPPRGPAR